MAIEKFVLRGELVKSGINNLIIAPKIIMGIVPIKIDLNNLFDKIDL